MDKPPCKTDPRAPHGFLRNASHNAGRYVCECEYWADPERKKYWLCCGSTEYPHGAENCIEAWSGHPERVRWGTAEDHGEWGRKAKEISINETR